MSPMSVRPPRVLILVAVASIVFANAICVVYSAARNRALFAELTMIRERHEKLVVTRGRLELEEWTLAAHARVASIAEQQLGMQEPKDVRIVEVR